MNNKNILKFIFELGQLKRVKHEGWKLIGIDNPESVAEHSLRAAQIGFILAKLEKYENPFEVCSILVFHDVAECRIGDIHRVGNRYISVDEEKVVEEQTAKLENIGKEISEMYEQIERKNTKAGIIAKDADFLEMAFMAKEYLERGYGFAQDWIDNISKSVQTKSAVSLLKDLQKSNSNDWWQGFKKMKKIKYK